MNTVICFRQGGNNLRLGNTLVWVEQAIDWCKINDFIFWLPNAEEILGELCDASSDVFSAPLNWDKSIFYLSSKYTQLLLTRIVCSVNDVKERGSVSDLVSAYSIVPEIIAYIDSPGNMDWSDISTDLIFFLKKHKLVIVNEPYPFKFSEVSKNTTLYLKPSKASMDFVENLPTKKSKNIGIHIRQGDFKYWRGGRYYQSSDFYNALIDSVIDKFQKTDTNILITHNGEFEISQSNQDLLMNNKLLYPDHELSDEVRDFLLLSVCDVVIGPTSTFSSQALKWGKRNNYSYGKWVSVQSDSKISDILEKLD